MAGIDCCINNKKRCDEVFFDSVNENIYVYGTGQYSRVFLSYMQLKGLESRIEGFIVTKMANQQELFYGHCVYEFNQIEDKLTGKIVCIAISEEKADGIKEKLQSAGVREIVQFNETIYNELEESLFAHYNAIEIQNKQVVVWNFWGLGYSDQCKYIAKRMHEADESVSIFWIVSTQGNYDFPEWITPIVIGTQDYYRVLCSSRLLVSNVNAPSSVRFKRKEQYYIYTWHGIGPSKRIEWQSPLHRKVVHFERERVKERWAGADIMVAGSDFCHEVYRDSFLYDGKIEKWGYPRNDVLFQPNDFREKVYKFFDIPQNKKILLYAPTFRNELINSGNEKRLAEIYDIDLGIVKEEIERRFAEEYVILYRFHHYVYRYVDISKYNQAGIDATFYPDMQELLVASEVLITDYSSSMWDFSLTRKPIFLYYHDAEEYQEKYQGFYVFPDEYPYPKGHNMQELCCAIRHFDDELYQNELDKWFKRFGTYDDGHATERVVARMCDVMNNPSKYGK